MILGPLLIRATVGIRFSGTALGEDIPAWEILASLSFESLVWLRTFRRPRTGAADCGARAAPLPDCGALGDLCGESLALPRGLEPLSTP